MAPCAGTRAEGSQRQRVQRARCVPRCSLTSAAVYPGGLGVGLGVGWGLLGGRNAWRAWWRTRPAKRTPDAHRPPPTARQGGLFRQRQDAVRLHAFRSPEDSGVFLTCSWACTNPVHAAPSPTLSTALGAIRPAAPSRRCKPSRLHRAPKSSQVSQFRMSGPWRTASHQLEAAAAADSGSAFGRELTGATGAAHFAPDRR